MLQGMEGQQELGESSQLTQTGSKSVGAEVAVPGRGAAGAVGIVLVKLRQ